MIWLIFNCIWQRPWFQDLLGFFINCPYTNNKKTFSLNSWKFCCILLFIDFLYAINWSVSQSASQLVDQHLKCLYHHYALPCSGVLIAKLFISNFLHANVCNCIRYLQQVLKESIRTSQFATFAARVSDSEIVLGGYTVPPKVTAPGSSS